MAKRQTSTVQVEKTPAMGVTPEGKLVVQACDPSVACPIMDRVELFAKRWSLQILKLLYEKDYSFVELQRGLNGVAPGMLSKRLKELEEAKVITRKVLSTRPISVSYHLNDSMLKTLSCWLKH